MGSAPCRSRTWQQFVAIKSLSVTIRIDGHVHALATAGIFRIKVALSVDPS